ncbi:acyl carrier protein [Actinomadura physcomitrii]|nr:acyl carrier protein [Actinomadura physcomitrii]
MSGSQTISYDELQMWLLDRIAFYLDRPTENIDPAVELARYGVDSVYAISIISDIEDHLQVEVDVAEARRRETVADLTAYLLDLVA